MKDLIDHIMLVMDAAFDPQWGERWTRRQVSDALMLSNTRAIIIDEMGQEIEPGSNSDCVGFTMTRSAADEEELLLIAVHPDFRGRGLGSKLIQILKSSAEERGIAKIFLEMRSNNPAENLYRKMGFSPIGRRNNYYRTKNGDQLDAITFGFFR